MDRIIDPGASKTTNFQQIPALGLELCHLFDFLLAHVLEVDHDTVGAGFGDGAVKGDHRDPGVAGLLDGAVKRIRRCGVDDDRVIALQDQVLDLGRLSRHFLVGGRKHVGAANDLVGHRFLADDIVAIEHRLPPGIPGIIIGKGDLFSARIGKHRTRRQYNSERAKREYLLHFSNPPIGLPLGQQATPISWGVLRLNSANKFSAGRSTCFFHTVCN